MTTIVDPAGSPAIIYNKSGTVIVPVTANGDDQTDATQIPNISGWQVILATVPSSGNHAVKLHPDAEIGTIVEFYHQGGPEFARIFAASGQSINGGSDSLEAVFGVFLRKVTSTDWRALNV